MGVIIPGANTLYINFCFFKQIPMVSKGLNLTGCEHKKGFTPVLVSVHYKPPQRYGRGCRGDRHWIERWVRKLCKWMSLQSAAPAGEKQNGCIRDRSPRCQHSTTSLGWIQAIDTSLACICWSTALRKTFQRTTTSHHNTSNFLKHTHFW